MNDRGCVNKTGRHKDPDFPIYRADKPMIPLHLHLAIATAIAIAVSLLLSSPRIELEFPDADFHTDSMVLVRYDKTPPNRTLQGHKLLVLVLPSWTPPEKDIEQVRNRYPDLVVQVGKMDELTKDDWKDVTILLTGYSRETLPKKDDVPKLQYVQLSSAGANLVVSDPLFSETDVAFCTANGVHG